jgi:hypothetical protein
MPRLFNENAEVAEIRRFADLDWGADFWRFVLLYETWPPFAWRAISHLTMLRAPFRQLKLVNDYVLTVSLMVLAFIAARAALDSNWLLAAVICLPVVSHLVVIALRLQATYRLSQKEPDRL